MKKNGKEDKTKKKGFFTPVKIIILIIILAIAGGGGFIAMTMLKGDGYPKKKLEQVALPEDLLKFSFTTSQYSQE